MRSLSFQRPRATAFLLVAMFLFADLALHHTMEGWSELEEEHSPQHVLSTHYVNADTYISEANPMSTYNTSVTGLLSNAEMNQARLLLRFPMNYTASDTIHTAEVQLQCVTNEPAPAAMSAYVAEMKQEWNGTYASWFIYKNGQIWFEQGGEDDADRGAWEPPATLVGNGTLTLNVTSIAQHAAKSNNANLSIIVASTGSPYTCDMSETTATGNEPKLVMNTSSTPASQGASVATDLPVDDGMPWMTSDFLLQPVTTPTLSYQQNTGQDVEMQLSNSEDFRSSTDMDWHFSTLWSTFASTGTTGAYNLPASLALSNGTTIHMRVRAVDSNDQWGAWDSTSFLLPTLDVVDNGDGTATMMFSATATGLEEDFIQDATVSETSKTINYGANELLESNMTSNKERLIHLRASLNQIGLHDNLTILDADLKMTRSSYSGDPVVSLHGMEESGLWVEDEITWNTMSSNGFQWYDGGRSNGTAAIGLFDGNQSSDDFVFNLEHAVQNYLDEGDAAPLDMMLAVRGKFEGYTNGEGIFFHSADSLTPQAAPSFSITYEWGSGTPPTPVSLTAPADGLAVWNITGHNLSGNTQPSLNWTQPVTGDDIVFELAKDEDFRLREMRVDTRFDTDFSPSDGIFNMTGSNTLEIGNMYFWRMATVDADDHYGSWVSSSFLVSSLESTWLGGDRYEFRLKHGNGSLDNQYPACMDTYIDSSAVSDNFDGDSEMTIDYNAMGSAEITGLLGCNLVSNLLPTGYAVESAHLQMVLTSSTFGNPTIAVWESRQNDWNAEDATWSSYDGSNSWATAGAKGIERGSLLDSVAVGNTYSEGDSVQWNVTLAVQNAMREDRRVDFIAGIQGVGTGGSRTAYFSTAEDSTSTRPELTFVYVPGSDALPNDPSPSLPLNGSWSIGSGVDLTPIATPQLEWNFNSNLPIAGFIVQFDTVNDFSSTASLSYTSWNDAGFDLTNNTFTPSTDLDTGETWFWRVRAVSATNQIGNWSNAFHFLLPDLDTVVFNATKASVDLVHQGALPDLDLPNFTDTYVIENGTGADSTYENSTTLRVGELSTGYQAAALIRIPLSEVPQPANARVTGAELNMFAEYGSVEDEPIAVRPVLRPWTTAANATTYDGTNSWSERGGRDIGVDVGGYVDLVDSVEDDWMEFDVTEAVQAALATGQSHLSLMLYASTQTSDVVTFTSTEGSTNERPYLTLVWEDGTVATPTVAGVNSAPSNGDIVWDTASHALQADRTPTFSWTYSGTPTATGWRVFIQTDANDDMAGLFTYDSRDSPTAFDLTNLQFTPPSDLTFAQEIRWMVQPINNGMLGPRSSSTIFYLPNDLGQELDANRANLSIQEGAFVPSLAYPSVTDDTYLDSGSIYADRGSSSSLYVGLRPGSPSTQYRTSTLMSIDFSGLPLPGTYEITDATLDLDAIGVYRSTFVTVSQMVTPWTESSVWAYPAGNTSTWQGAGAYHTTDSMAPFNPGQWVNSTGTVSFNITAIAQHARAAGLSKIDVILQAEDMEGFVDGRVQFASSEAPTISERPRLNMTYSLDVAWSPSAPTNLLPVDGATLWDTSMPRPSGQDETDINWSSSYTNQTRWVACVGSDSRMIDSDCVNMDDVAAGSEENLSFDPASLTLTIENHTKADEWVFWRVRAEQGNRIGEWSSINKYRNPENQGSDDGNGNHTVNLSRGSVFETTGLLPAVPDVQIDSASTVNRGSSASMLLGNNLVGSGESRILMEFNLTDLPWPSAMTPTQMMLRMYQSVVVGTSSTTVAVYPCSSFVESSVIWATAPSCSTNEITRTTLPISSSDGWKEWDLTSLAQSNIANGNTTMTFMLQRVGNSTSTHDFFSSESTFTNLRPHLILDYVDNVDGIVPPAQPALISPADGQVLYEESGGLLTPSTQPTLSWSPLAGATGYIVTVANESGVYKFRSWEDSEITNTTFRFADNLSAGQMFSWWVQGVNQSIPGPSSSRWSFAVGAPDHVYNSNTLTYTYTMQTGNEIAAFGHTNIQDATIFDEYPDTNFGGTTTLAAGTYCGTLYTDECRITLGLNAAQIPFPQYQQVHSASLGLYVDSWQSVQGATSVSFAVHPITNPAWAQTSVTWNGTTSGANWGAPGMQAGVDYGDAISTTVVNVDTYGWIWFDISTLGMTINNQQAWVIVASPNVGSAHASFHSSDSTDASYRPQILFNTTNISTLTLTPGGVVTTDADSSLNFNAVAYDHLNMVRTVPVDWYASSGSIGSNGLFTPTVAGVHNISACFGIVCGTQSVTVTPGAPVELVATPLVATITADESLTINAYMADQHGNSITGETILLSASNGTIVGSIFQPFAAGNHTITVSHPASGLQTTVDITVLPGVASYFVLGGCEGTVPAGVWCDITIDLYDQFGNELTLAEAGSLTWSTTNGNYSEINSQYFPDHVGVWWLNLTSTSGASDELAINVGHGQIDYLELNVSSTSITADDRVYINTTRVDVRGNRLPVVLPADNWTMIADGQLSAGAPAIWDPVGIGERTLQARYETTLAAVSINVGYGQIQTLRLVVADEEATWEHFDLTADETLEADVFAIDAKGNQWEINANWSLDHPSMGDSSNFLEVLVGDSTTFTPYFASDDPYILTATYDDGIRIHAVSINMTVDHGFLHTVSIRGTANNADATTGAVFEMTSDYAVDFVSDLYDADNNRIDSGELTWTETNVETGEVREITTELLLNEMRWEATTVGEWKIDAFKVSGTGFNITDSITVTVLHGVAVTVDGQFSTLSPVAGDTVNIQVTGTDADGNEFPQNVEWSENGAQVPTLNINTTSDGTYTYDAEIAGEHVLEYVAGGATSTVVINVSAQNTVARLEVNLSSYSLEQLQSLDLSIRAFDAFDNEIPVPGSVKVEATGRATTSMVSADSWTVTTLDDGPQTITISVGAVRVNEEINVVGTFQGFFEAGGTLYYVGAGLLALVAIALLVLGVMFVRSGGSGDWDDDYDDDDDEEEDRPRGPTGPAPGPTGPAPGPTGPAPGPSGPPPTEAPPVEEVVEEELDTTFDEDGTEWWEDEEGTWWYRNQGEEEWQEYSE